MTRRLALLVALLASTASAAQLEGRKVSGRELMKMGFFQDFEELSLEDLLTPVEATVSVASRQPTPVERAPGIISLIEGDEIRDLDARTLEDVLRLLPGIDMTVDRLGRSRISLRGVPSGLTGGASENVLVLLNGQRLNDDLLGGAGSVNLNLPADHIQKVELLRGPGSVLFGDGALTGVISITLKSADDFGGTEILAGGGSFGTQDYAVRSGARFNDVQVSGFVRFQDTKGAQLPVLADAQTVADATSGRPPISLAPGRTTDDVRTVEAAYAFRRGDWTLNLRSRSERGSGLIGWSDSLGRQNDLANRQTNVDLGWKRDLGRIGAVETHLSYTQSSIRQILDLYPSGYRFTPPVGDPVDFGKPHGDGGVFLDTRLGLRRIALDNVFARELAPHHQLTAGFTLAVEGTHNLKANGNLDFRDDAPVPPAANGGLGPLDAAVAESRRSEVSVFAEDVWTPSSRLTLTGGLRFDHTWGVGGTVVPRIALTGNLPSKLESKLPAALREGLTYKLLYGRSFRVPTFAELYFNLPGFTGNPNLKPVTSDSVEAGLNYKSGPWRAAVTGYLNLVDRPIGTGEPFDPVGTTLLRNLDGYRVFGVEVELRKKFGVANYLFGNASHQHAVERASGEPIPDLPANLANFGATFGIRERYTITPTLELRGSRPRAAGDTRPDNEAIALFGLAARARDILRGWSADLLLQNLFDQRYADPAPLLPGDYPRPGRRVLLHVSYRF